MKDPRKFRIRKDARGGLQISDVWDLGIHKFCCPDGDAELLNKLIRTIKTSERLVIYKEEATKNART